ncbi:MAG: DUF4038 domain-containing protein [Clostridia bacterium]
MKIESNEVLELCFHAQNPDPDPYNRTGFHAVFQGPEGQPLRIPGFWAGKNKWCLRFASHSQGLYRYETFCSDATDKGLHGHRGTVTVTPARGNTSLCVHGPLQAMGGGHTLSHADGTPFLWLGDTWWMGLTTRLSWPKGFRELLADRVEKGFTVVQMVMGLYPDMEPFDPKGANEAGFPFEHDFTTINPFYFDHADKKISALAEAGLVPCLVACWGFFIKYMGVKAIKKYWEYLIARYGAYPVVWCLAGEAVMPFYLDEAFSDKKLHAAYVRRTRRAWTGIAAHVQKHDPYRRVLTIHPTDYGRRMVDDDSLLDMEMLQTGHGGFMSLEPSVSMLEKALRKTPSMPVVNSEVCYEGICGSNHADVQRFLYWSCMLSGSAGYTYGANGIWQLNSREQPYGPSPHGASWGDTPWEEACHLPGSLQIGLAKELLMKYEWWKFKPHPEWVDMPPGKRKSAFRCYSSGIPGKVRVMFIPFFAGMGWQFTLAGLEPGSLYKAWFFDPLTGDWVDQGTASPDTSGKWTTGKIHKFQDWVVVLEAQKGNE